MEGENIGWAVAISGAIGTIAGAVGTQIVNVINALGKAKQTERADAIVEYKELVDGMQARVKDLFSEVQQLRAEHFNCQRENAVLQVRVQNLSDQVEVLKTTIIQMKGAA